MEIQPHEPAKTFWRITARLAWSYVLIFLLTASTVSVADSWMLPTVKTHLSPDKSKRLTLYPRIYPQDDAETASDVGTPEKESSLPRAKLEQLKIDGKWELLWQRAVINYDAPVSALVTDDGQYVVTFDNWGSRGLGENVIVIYGPQSRLIRSLQLSDFLPEEYVYTMPRSVSSIHWGGEHYFDETQTHVVLRIAEPLERSADFFNSDHVSVPVTLSDGHVTLPRGEAWSTLLARAKELDADRVAFMKQERLPLSAPMTRDDSAWITYQQHAYRRLFAGRANPAAFCHPRAEEILANNASEKIWECLDHAINRWDHSPESDSYAVLISAYPDRLSDLLLELLPKVKAGELNDVTIYFFGDETTFARVSHAFARTGAKPVLIDTTKSIAPRPDDTE